MARKGHKKSAFPEEDPVFQIAPMIDVLLQILVFFMAITTVEVMRTSKDVKLPLAQHGQKEESKKDLSIVNILWKGENHPPYMDIDNIPAPDPSVIAGHVAEAIRYNPEFRVIIRADRGTEYQFIQQVMQACAGAGCSRVSFAVINQENLAAVE